MKISLLLTAMLPTCIGASTFRPRSSHGYLPPLAAGAKSLDAAVLTKDVNIASNSDLTTSISSEQCKSNALSYRGGDATANVDIPKTNEIVGATFFTVLQILLNKVFRANNISFPAMLGCTISVFTTLVIAEAIVPGVGDIVFNMLVPGSNLLTKWLPVSLYLSYIIHNIALLFVTSYKNNKSFSHSNN